MPVPPYRSFSPADAAAMNRLELTARHVVDGLVGGQHRSPHRGFSIEFSEHRNYVAGDDVKHLDWRAYARSDRYYVKLYEQETNLRATIVLDCSASMQFAGKLEYAKHLAACLAYLLSTQQDHSGLVVVDDEVRAELPPGSSATHLDRLFLALDVVEPGGRTALPAQLHALAERLPRRSLLIVLSDLWTDDGLPAALRHVRHRRHQAMVLHLLDRAELDLPYHEHVTLRDLETRETLQIDPRDLRESYRANVADYLATVRRACSDCDVEYHDLFVDEPYDKALVRLLSRRGGA